MEYIEKNSNALDIVTTRKSPLNDIADWVNNISYHVVNNINNMRSIVINIGDIQLQSIQDVNGLSNAIIQRLTNAIALKLHKI